MFSLQKYDNLSDSDENLRMNAYIKGISYYLPKKVVTNEELVREFPEWTVDKIAAKVGVGERHVVDAEETAVDLAVKASELLFSESGFDRSQVDFVLLCTQSPDYLLPTSACIVQHRLGLPTGVGALDFNLGCSGFVYGLSLAKGLIYGGIARNVLLITSKTYSKYLHPRDKGNRTIFGDGAAATLVSTEGRYEIGEFSLGTDGSGAENLIVKNGGSRSPEKTGVVEFDEGGNPHSDDYLFMDGPEIFNFTITAVPPLVRDTLVRNKLEQNDIDLFVFHQANLYMINFLRRKLKIEEEKFYVCLKDVGNTVSASIPIALRKAEIEQRLKGNILLAGFGVGYSWGGVILKG